jgi:hypothetical protein
MTDRFEQLLHELGPFFQLQLHTDRHNACTVRIHEALQVQLQLDQVQENLLIFSEIAEIPPGKFREQTLLQALKYNGLPDPRIGILGYVARSDVLALYQTYPISLLNGESLYGLLGPFLELAESWRKAIENGQTAPSKMT